MSVSTEEETPASRKTINPVDLNFDGEFAVDLPSYIKLLVKEGEFTKTLIDQEVVGFPCSREILLALCEKDQFIKLVTNGCVNKAEINLLIGELYDQLFRYNRKKGYLQEPGRIFLKQLETELLEKMYGTICDSGEFERPEAETDNEEDPSLEPSKSARVDSENSVIAMICGYIVPAWLSSCKYSDAQIEGIFFDMGLTRMEQQVVCYRHGIMNKSKEDFNTIAQALYNLDAAPMVQKIYTEALAKLVKFNP